MEEIRKVRSPGYNYNFSTKTGYFERWGKTREDDPDYSPFGPEILDIEISTICNQGCKFCYKGNTSQGENMSLETFKKLFSKFSKDFLPTQIAFGIGGISENPDLWNIMWYCRDNGVIPNITINGYGMTPELYDKLVAVCGAVAVSLYSYDICFNAVQELTKRGLKQVNIHCMLSAESFDKCFAVQLAKENDSRLKGLNAIVYLRLKPKGRGIGFHQIEKEKYQFLVNRALERRIPIGFDSCSAPSFAEVIKNRKDREQLMQYVEPCESLLMSFYVDVNGKGYPCSFAEGSKGWEEGLDILGCNNFLADVWNHPRAVEYREASIKSKDCNGCRNCLIYDLK